MSTVKGTTALVETEPGTQRLQRTADLLAG